MQSESRLVTRLVRFKVLVAKEDVSVGAFQSIHYSFYSLCPFCMQGIVMRIFMQAISLTTYRTTARAIQRTGMIQT